MLYLWLCLSMLLLGFHGSVHGYMIDQDCGEDTQFVKDRIDTAFRLIANAVTELNRDPINVDVDDWHNELFGRRFDPEYTGIIKKRFVALSRLSQHNNNDQTSIAQNIVDVRVYCTVKRIGKNKEGIYINKDRNVAYEKGDLSKPGGRFGNCYDIKDPTMMVTLTAGKEFSEIQICPWYLRKARGFKFKDLADIPASIYSALGKVAIPTMAKLKYTPIDIFLLMDKVIVHELTHTEQAFPATKDLDPKPYGLKNAKKLVLIYNQNPEAQFDPLQNADSNSLFAVGTWLIVQPDGGPINPDGTFRKPQTTPKAKI
ncbi:uncharacterized protein K460DRAFT_406679 [Cucurbitaria berberidis CBS 394.84]|uniref:Lysine-specific metallo-endopeptidase domain-containing protein n=1 Tax=Cucurbitaria berberidis CBS 394.84 TaxID=1168544 RepID=A0A9P4GJV2_9PLEO|nr:uncharacterized protein K460DRAFT_406679 [Cucurbitaria berberidis CBS 394.84]KAF1846476.1 hypothetical protein K460DRAFT_406679 [Cucurbitaria berberidis CBS 394.84]